MAPPTSEPPSAAAEGGRFGPFVLRRRLGSGGSAEVWEAVMEGPGGFQKPVALKVLHPSLQRDPQWRGHFLREARLGARLQHPNLVATLLVHEVDARTCVALELVRGCTAAELLRHRKRPLPPNVVLEVALQVVEALDHIHTFAFDGRPAGVIHRDVKPSNLLLDIHGLVKLADLGISVSAEEAGPFAGTPGYAAPEQIEGAAEPRSDLFSLGVSLFALAAGRAPFGAGEAALAATRRVEELLRRPSFLAPVEAALPGLGEVLRRCLRSDPADRPASAAALRPALEALRPAAGAGPGLRELVAACCGAPGGAPASSNTPIAAQPTSGNVPPARDAFVGRREDRERLDALVARERWVVVTGPGGLGKTRLTLELARSTAGRFPGGCWWFDLASARSVDDVCAAVAQALRVPLQSADPALQLGHALNALGSCLLLLDNLEQCVDALPRTLERWRSLAPEARVVGTSRVRPGLPGEVVFPLGGMDRADALALFEQRTPRPLRPEERDHLSALCAALDGMPLAVELAAARLRVLGVEEVARRLSMRLLGGGGAERPVRHRSLEASLGWSWDLLSPTGRSALAQVSVFEGGFDWSAAEAVLDLGAEGPWALDALQELIDASLVRADAATGRLSTWLVVREYAGERLTPESRRAAEERHGQHFARMTSDRASLAGELDNLVAACRRAVARGDGEVALRALERAGKVFALQGPYPTWVALATSVREMTLPTAQALAARAEFASSMTTQGHQGEVRALLEDALRQLDALAPADRAAVPASVEIRLLGALGQGLIRQGLFDASAEVLERWLSRCRAAGDRSGEASALAHVGHVQLASGDFAGAHETNVRAIQVCREAGDRAREATTHRMQGVLAMRLVRVDDALDCFQTALRLSRAVGDRANEGRALHSLGAAYQAAGRLDDAHVHYDLALAIHRAVGNRVSAGATLSNLGTVLDEQGRPEDAAALFAQAAQLHAENLDLTSESIARANLADLRRRQGNLAEARTHAASARERLPKSERRTMVAVLCIVGDIETDLGSWSTARAAFDEAAALLSAALSPTDRATFLASRARCDAGAGEVDAARRGLAEAVALAAPLRPAATSALGRALAAAEAAVRAAAP